MIDRPAAAITAAAIAPITLPRSVRERIFLYLGILIILLAFGAPYGGLMDIPISFFLNNKLHLKAHEVAEFRLVSAIPLYLSCIFGFIRDMWNPFRMRDRGFILLFGTISAGLYVFFAFISITYVTLLVAVVLLTTSFLFVASAQNGLTSMIGQQHACPVRSARCGTFLRQFPPLRLSSSAALLATCSKTGTLIRLPASYFSSAPRSWPRWPCMPCGSLEACLTTSAPNTGLPRIC